MSALDTQLSRREFLKLTGAAGAATVLRGDLAAFVPAPVYARPTVHF